VRDILCNKQTVIRLLDNHGRQIIDLAEGIDERQVTPHDKSEDKSISREQTFQHDTSDFSFLKDVLRLLAKELSLKLRLSGIYVRTVTLMVKYSDMKLITRSKSGDSVSRAKDIFDIAATLLDSIERRAVRLVGISLSGLTDSDFRQLTLDDMGKLQTEERRNALDGATLKLQRKYGGAILKTGNEMAAEKRFEAEETSET
jgi:nucleotidyltransferase/DNA polymerase involved in DNA repair